LFLPPALSRRTYLAALLVAVAACSNPETPSQPLTGASMPQDPSVPVKGDVLVVALPFDPGTLYPVGGTYDYSAMIRDLVQSGMMRRTWS